MSHIRSFTSFLRVFSMSNQDGWPKQRGAPTYPEQTAAVDSKCPNNGCPCHELLFLERCSFGLLQSQLVVSGVESGNAWK